MKNTIKCKKCGNEIEITEALRFEIEEQTKLDVEKKIRKEYEEKSSFEIADLKKQIEEKEKKAETYKGYELKLREENRKLQEEKKDLSLTVQRKVDEESKKIEERVLKQAAEDHYFKDKEKEKIIGGLKKSLEEARLKANVGSQQLQGEVLELDLEEELRRNFPHDEIIPVEKGEKGADVKQIVKSPKGIVCGVILWEAKRAKAWKDVWAIKLRDELRSGKANFPVIVTNIFPKEIKNGILGQKDGVLVVGFNLYLPLAVILRKNLLDVGYQKALSIHRGEKTDLLYEYITSHEFIHQVEAIVEVYKESTKQVANERIVFEKNWKARDEQAKRLLLAAANIVGSIQGKVGQTALPIKELDLLQLESGETKKEEK
ncbi:hypothetical protein CO049_03730 [Candidatus Roizmanbacteria bacterium CG_4_9_14_0_2_um_filter_36_12]|uniref:DUF2130 domain-containing protein n=1 Tax=Candidatus Roizmanbacteria bacterium CG_4_9_14_0_2_um_filter_36_12 TaxID=1974837 RepID=A0A2M8EYX0_9BACT|nr:MAG: hypothetical protein CO049_03730 [Candidatus Roizmanbacteria bacterium CG_4_9_14_0_2_um_filter_36_12]